MSLILLLIYTKFIFSFPTTTYSIEMANGLGGKWHDMCTARARHMFIQYGLTCAHFDRIVNNAGLRILDMCVSKISQN